MLNYQRVSQLEGGHDIKNSHLKSSHLRPELGKNKNEIHCVAICPWMDVAIFSRDRNWSKLMLITPLVESESVRLHPFRGYILRVRTLGRPTELTCHLPPPGWQRCKRLDPATLVTARWNSFEIYHDFSRILSRSIFRGMLAVCYPQEKQTASQTSLRHPAQSGSVDL
jgi:hypothetical protein